PARVARVDGHELRDRGMVPGNALDWAVELTLQAFARADPGSDHDRPRVVLHTECPRFAPAASVVADSPQDSQEDDLAHDVRARHREAAAQSGHEQGAGLRLARECSRERQEMREKLTQ